VAIDPEDKSYYLTEGDLRLLHRKLDASQQTLHTYTHRDAQPVPEDQEIEADLTLLPISVLLRKGTHLQLLLASGDDATFVSQGRMKRTSSLLLNCNCPWRTGILTLPKHLFTIGRMRTSLATDFGTEPKVADQKATAGVTGYLFGPNFQAGE
jgi:hypothetical protein